MTKIVGLCALVVLVLGGCGQKPGKPAEIRPAPTPQPPAAPAAVSPQSYLHEIVGYDAPAEVQADSVVAIPVRVKNASDRTWPANGPIKVGCYWLDSAGTRLEKLEGRGNFTEDVLPGALTETVLRAKAPTTPGTYQLVLDVVEEHVAWFGNKGSTPVKVSITVK